MTKDKNSILVVITTQDLDRHELKRVLKFTVDFDPLLRTDRSFVTYKMVKAFGSEEEFRLWMSVSGSKVREFKKGKVGRWLHAPGSIDGKRLNFDMLMQDTKKVII